MTREAVTLWLTGLPCIGKTTTALAIYRCLSTRGVQARVLDSDEIAPCFRGLAGDSAQGRDIVSRAMAMAAMHLNRSGISCICAATSPRCSIRKTHRDMIPGYVEIFCCGSVNTARARDTLHLYDMADVGFIKNFTGVDEPYEDPKSPDLVLDMALTPEDCALAVINHLKQGRFAAIFPDQPQTILQEHP